MTSGSIPGMCTILLADDEEMVLDVSAELLKEFGYSVLEARGGREAVRIYEANRERIDLVILDMYMPDINGAEVFDRLKEINPDIKVLMSSGYNLESHAHEALALGCVGFVRKPYTIKQLRQTIEKTLGRD